MWQKRKITKSHASGVVVLIFTVLFIQGVLFLFSKDDKKAEELPEQVDKNTKLSAKNETAEKTATGVISKSNIRSEEKPFLVSKFNPNTIDSNGLMHLGFTSGQARVVVNYRNKGGVFRSPEDFSKIYVVTPEMFDRLREFISIDTTGTENPVATAAVSSKTDKLSINSADSAELVSLPGIGPHYATKIIRYRELLGGFAQKEQLKEIYGIDNERYNLFADRIEADTNDVLKRDIMEVTFEELSRNPYIGAYVARSIIKFRERSGTEITDLAKLAMSNIIRKELYKILRFYYK